MFVLVQCLDALGRQETCGDESAVHADDLTVHVRRRFRRAKPTVLANVSTFGQQELCRTRYQAHRQQCGLPGPDVVFCRGDKAAGGVECPRWTSAHVASAHPARAIDSSDTCSLRRTGTARQERWPCRCSSRGIEGRDVVADFRQRSGVTPYRRPLGQEGADAFALVLRIEEVDERFSLGHQRRRCSGHESSPALRTLHQIGVPWRARRACRERRNVISFNPVERCASAPPRQNSRARQGASTLVLEHLDHA